MVSEEEREREREYKTQMIKLTEFIVINNSSLYIHT